MYDLAVVNSKPGACEKCRGSGRYRWGAVINGRATHEGTCFSCRGTGRQQVRDMKRNAAYNRFKVGRIMAADFRMEPAEVERKRCDCEHGDGEPVLCMGKCEEDKVRGTW